jgi:hypothetical protein
VAQIFGDEHRRRAVGRLREARRDDRGELESPEVGEDLELAPRDLDGQLLQRVELAVDLEEADEVARRPDRDPPEGERVGPLPERQLPREPDQARGRGPEAEMRELGGRAQEGTARDAAGDGGDTVEW